MRWINGLILGDNRDFLVELTFMSTADDGDKRINSLVLLSKLVVLENFSLHKGANLMVNDEYSLTMNKSFLWFPEMMMASS